MSLESVRAFLQANAPDIELIETDDSSSTVELAAKVHRVEPAQIANWARTGSDCRARRSIGRRRGSGTGHGRDRAGRGNRRPR